MLQHFESDDPDLYTSKIEYILKSDDVGSLDLNFTEEVYGRDGSVKVRRRATPASSRSVGDVEKRFESLSVGECLLRACLCDLSQ